MSTTKKYPIENTMFSIMIDNTLTDLDRKVLTHLYLPIIGDKALSIYLTLYTMLEPGSRESNNINHLQILKILNLKSDGFIEERIKLEAIGLLTTYYKDGLYVYVLKKVLTPYEFFVNKDLVRIMNSIIGEVETQNLAYDFLLRKIDPYQFEDITSRFDEVYDLVDDEIVDYSRVGVDTRNNGIVISDDVFNSEYFLLLVEAMDLVQKEVIFNTDFLDKMKRYAFLYGLTVEQLRDAVKNAVNFEGMITSEDLDYWIKKVYDDRKEKKTFVPKKTVVKTSNRLINFLNAASPNDIVKAKYKTELTSSEIAMFDKLLMETNVSIGVLNAAVLYVMVEKNGAIPGYNYFLKVINTWIRAGITTAEAALNHINNQDSKQPKRMVKQKTVKETPEWYNKQKQEEVNNQQEDNANLVDIADFFKPKQ